MDHRLKSKWGILISLTIITWAMGAVHPRVILNEFMAANDSNIPNAQGEFSDWLELYNPSNVPVDLTGMFLTDDIENPTQWRFPSSVISAGGYLLIWADNTEAGEGYHCTFSLRAAGEELALFARDGLTLLDYVEFGQQISDVSYGRNPADHSTWGYCTTATPGAANTETYLGIVAGVKATPERGFYEHPTTVTLTCDTPEAEIWYTTNMEMPHAQNDKGGWTGQVYTHPIAIERTTCIRAVAVKPGWKSSPVTGYSYIFLDDVLNQYDPNSIETTSVGRGGQIIPHSPIYLENYVPTGFPNTVDYDIDPLISEDPNYQPTLKEDLLSIPSVSIIIDINDFFGWERGIYTHPQERGIQWERFATMEWIDPNTGNQFGVNAGLRIHGGVGRVSKKKSLRMLFKSKYGPSQLTFPLFTDTPVSTFENLVLRGCWNYSWHGHSGMGGSQHAQYLRDAFARDTIRDLQQPTPHGRHVHVYIDGLYWGLYVLTERPDDGFAAQHLGGDKEDYDVLKAPNGFGDTSFDVIAGDPNQWDTLFAAIDDVNAVPGLTEQGLNDYIKQRINLPNLIDYMLMVIYVGSYDAPNFMQSQYPRNLYTLRNHKQNGSFIFLPWDVEWCLDSPNINAFTWIGGIKNPGRLFLELKDDQEFRRQVADRIHQCFFNDGVLTVDQCSQRYWQRSMDIDRAIVGESIRWGNGRTRNDDWVVERDRLMNQYFPLRTNIVLKQLIQEGWYPSVMAPTFLINGISQHGGDILLGNRLSINNPNNEGLVYYTLDGSDPRPPLNANETDIQSTGIQYQDPIILTQSTRVKASTLVNGQWSALNEAFYSVRTMMDSLYITEIMYHPPDDGAEFIELTNLGTETINLDGIRFVAGIDYEFGNVELSPGSSVLLVRDLSAFLQAYKVDTDLIAGQYQGKLDNGGERLELQDATGTTHLSFTYNDAWYPNTDGKGYSLIPVNPVSRNSRSLSQSSSWRSSPAEGGTPGQYP